MNNRYHHNIMLKDEICFKLSLKYNPIYFKQYVRVFIVQEHSDVKKKVKPGKIFKMNGSDFMKPQTSTQNDDVLNSSNSSGGVNNNNNSSTSQHNNNNKQNINTSTNAINVSNKYYNITL